MKYPAIEKLIRENNLTVVSLAKRIGVPKSTLYNKLMGDSDVGIVLAKKIKTALGTSEPIEVLFPQMKRRRPRRHKKGGRQWKQKRAPARRWTITALPTAKNAAPSCFAMSAAICQTLAPALWAGD